MIIDITFYVFLNSFFLKGDNEMRPKLNDVAKYAGVSPTTVSRVLNDRGYISEKTRKKVYEAISAINYFPNEMARTLSTKQSNIIGLIFPTITNPFFAELVFHIEMQCEKLGYKVFLCNSLNHADKEKKYLDMLISNQVDGIIVGSHNRGVFEKVVTNLPIVALDQFISDSAPIISSDNYAGGKLATEHLIKKGCKKVIHISGPSNLNTPTHLRTVAYKEVMSKYGLEPIIYETHQTFNPRSNDDMIMRMFEEVPDVEGIFASDDVIAAKCYYKALSSGKNVPDDIKIVGYDGTETAEGFLPQLTTIKQPISKMAERAVKLLDNKIKGESICIDSNEILEIQFIEGSTT